MNMTKVVHLSTVHAAHDSRILHKECRTLAAAGYDVVFIVPTDRAAWVEGVRIRPLPRPSGRAGRVTSSAWRLWQAAMQEDADLYHFHDPELLTVGLALKKSGKRVVYDVHEDLPRQIMSKEWLPDRYRGRISRLAEAAEDWGARHLDGVVAATPTIAARFPQSRTAVVLNYPLLNELMEPDARPYAEREPIVTYIGGIKENRGAFEMVEAVSQVETAQLVLAGTFIPADLEGRLRKAPRFEQTQFLGWQSREGVKHLLAKSRIGLVTLHPAPNYLESFPIKLFEYMAAGLPVIASDFPLWRSIVGEAQCGLLVDPLDPRAIAEAISWLLARPAEAEAMGRRGRAAVLDRFNWSSQAHTLVDFYGTLLATGARSEGLARLTS